jgi:hypothetical protein
MCEKCMEFEREIQRYQRLCLLSADQPTIELYKRVIRELICKKLDLHTVPADEK